MVINYIKIIRNHTGGLFPPVFLFVHKLFSKKVLTNRLSGYNINTVVSTRELRVLTPKRVVKA